MRDNNEIRKSGDSVQSTARTLGRLVAITMVALGSLAVLLGMTACDPDDDGPGQDWYLSGVWENNSAIDEDMVFYSDGTGYWTSNSTGSYLDFDYYCLGDWIYFTMYPDYGPSYTLDCTIGMMGPDDMYITWPANSMYGPTTIYYSRVD